MAPPAPSVDARRSSRWSVTVWAVLSAAFAVLLLPPVPESLRESASGLGLLVGGLAAMASLGLRARSEGPRGRPWRLLASAALVAVAGNVWVTAIGADPVSDPSIVSDLTIFVALLLSIGGLLSFPAARQRGAELAGMFLDGLVAGGALLLIASVLVYGELLDAPSRGSALLQVLALVFPVLDIVLTTVAVMLVLRARRSDRTILLLVASGFLLYAASDLVYAVRLAQEDFAFGTVTDLGWIIGYLTLALAGRVRPTAVERQDETPVRSTLSDFAGTVVVFAVLLVAALVQVIFGVGDDFKVANAALWVVLVAAAAVRQILLTRDNLALRRGLEHRVAEQTADLRRLARQNEVLLTSVGDGIYGVDQQGRVTFVNPSGAAVLGFTPEELVGRRAHEVFHAPQEDGLPFPWEGCYIYQAITMGSLAQSEEDEYLRRDGSVFPVEITASPLMDDDERRGAVVVFRDVTQRREVDRMKNEFLAVVSHELRTPLTSIRGSLGLLASGRLGELPERAESLVNVAVQNSERLTRLINDLLDMERIESGTAPLTVTRLDVATLLDDTVQQISGMASSMGVTVEVERAEGAVMADEDRTVQTLMNLAGNALKFSERGSAVTLAARVEDREVHVTVTDRGRGIPEDKLDRIFERFEQVDSSDARQKGGTGLGLTISKGIVEMQGGRIWIESELGVGTVAHFTLPLAPAVWGEPAPPAGVDDPSLPRVLVCDDDPATVDELSRMLREHDFQPVGTTEGARVLEIARDQHPQAVLLDLMMPGTGGAEVLADLRGAPDTAGIPVVVVSGFGPRADEDVARDAEAWLVKPVSEHHLMHALTLALSGPQPRGSVLLVEDDDGLAEVIGTLLLQEGLDVVRASAAGQAVVRGEELRPDVIILDMRLPDGDGGDVVAEFRRRGTLTETPVIFYSAADIDDGRRDELSLGPTVFLTKGRVTPEMVKDQVLDLVGANQPGRSGLNGTRHREGEPDDADTVRAGSTSAG